MPEIGSLTEINASVDDTHGGKKIHRVFDAANGMYDWIPDTATVTQASDLSIVGTPNPAAVLPQEPLVATLIGFPMSRQDALRVTEEITVDTRVLGIGLWYAPGDLAGIAGDVNQLVKLPEQEELAFNIQYLAGTTGAGTDAEATAQGINFVNLGVGAPVFPAGAKRHHALHVVVDGQATFNNGTLTGLHTLKPGDVYEHVGGDVWIRRIEGSKLAGLAKFRTTYPGVANGAVVVQVDEIPWLDANGYQSDQGLVPIGVRYNAGSINANMSYFGDRPGPVNGVFFYDKNNPIGVTVSFAFGAEHHIFRADPDGRVQNVDNIGVSNLNITINGVAVADGQFSATVTDAGPEWAFEYAITPANNGVNALIRVIAPPLIWVAPVTVRYNFTSNVIQSGFQPAALPTWNDLTINGDLYNSTTYTNGGAHNGGPTRYWLTQEIDTITINAGGGAAVRVGSDPFALDVTGTGVAAQVVTVTFKSHDPVLWGNLDGTVPADDGLTYILRAEEIILPDETSTGFDATLPHKFEFFPQFDVEWNDWDATGVFSTEGGAGSPTTLPLPNSVVGTANTKLIVLFHPGTPNSYSFHHDGEVKIDQTPSPGVDIPVHRAPVATVTGIINPVLGNWNGKPIYAAILEVDGVDNTNKAVGPPALLDNLDSIRSFEVMGMESSFATLDANRIRHTESRSTSGITWSIQTNQLFYENQAGLGFRVARLMVTWTKI